MSTEEKLMQPHGNLKPAQFLTLQTGNISIKLSLYNCTQETDTLQHCSAMIELTVPRPGVVLRQTLNLASFYLCDDASLYRGRLDENYLQRAHSLILADVNGDGSDDLLVRTGKRAAYGGPSFDVFLLDDEAGQFMHSKEFSDLTIGYNGLFMAGHGVIRTLATHDCCVRTVETYEVRANKPILVDRITTDYSDPDIFSQGQKVF